MSFGCYIVDRVVKECFDYLDAPPQRVTNHFVPMSYNETQENNTLPTADKTIAAIKSVMYR